jgi:hypothetical protein
MSKKLQKHLGKINKDKNFLKGADYARNLFDIGLEDVFGKKLGSKFSQMLIEKALKLVPKAKKIKKTKKPKSKTKPKKK